MGAIDSSNAIFLTIADGKISRRFLQPTDKTVERTNKNGKIVFEEFYKGWKGRITDIAVRDHPEYGKKWNITLSDNEGDAILQMNYSSGYSAAFLKALPNVDLNSDVIITPKMTIEGDKKKTSVFINQHGVALKWAFTKDSPNGLPELKQIKVKGKITWDDSDIMEFLEKMVKETIVPKLSKAGLAGAVTLPSEEVDAADPSEDLPF